MIERGGVNMEGRVSDLYQRITTIEEDLRRMEDKWQKSVDDIKDIIRSQFSELKSEQLAELKAKIREGDASLDDLDKRLRKTETRQHEYDTATSIAGWLVKTGIAVGGAIAGVFGWENWPHH